MTTPSPFLSPDYWHTLLTRLDDNIHLIKTSRGINVGNLHLDDEMEDALAPTLQIAALWSGLEPYVSSASRGSPPTPVPSFLAFATAGVYGDVQRLLMPSLGLHVFIHNTGDASLTTMRPLSAHTRLARAQAIAPWKGRNAWPDTITTLLLARHDALLGLPPKDTPTRPITTRPNQDTL